MPEIAEVARVTHYLRQHLVGKTIAKIVALDDASVFGKVGTSGAAFQSALSGRRVVGAGSQGKYFWLELDRPPHAVMHLGMTGWVHVRGEQTAYTKYAERAKGEDKDAWPPKYWKFHLETAESPAVGVAFTDARRFGRVRLVDCPGAEIRSRSPLAENGPDPVVDRDRFTETYLREKMRGRHVPIKALLLDQAMISGIGNWVGDEVLYQAGLHPEQYSDDFSDGEVAKLYRAVCDVCDVAVGHLGDSDKFPQDWLFHHRWGKGKKDAATKLPSGEKIIFVTVGGRTSCVVPSRQKKTGRVVAGVKEEEPEPEPETKSKAKSETKTKTKANTKANVIKEKKNSRYFDEDVDEQDDDRDVEMDSRPAKKARAAPRKAVKEEDDEAASEDVADSKKSKGGIRKAKEEKKEKLSVSSIPDTGRRRSTRLSKAVS
ncbi:formamidopyrimidine-DNA glycosylase [Nemania sp. FL0916]|nr:formamidopyrimidine-DNA glycosylase [Nemania sp. FL0916]